MSNLRKILKGMEKRYAVYTALSPVSMIGEVLLETYIPLVMAKIIDVGIANRDLPYVLRTGIFMVCCALFYVVRWVLDLQDVLLKDFRTIYAEEFFLKSRVFLLQI